MARFFIHRPIFAIVIALVITIVGIISALQLAVAQYPQISPPSVTVGTMYTGANASVVNDTVASIIEEQINGTEGMDYMSSNSDDTGRYSLTVTFDTDTDADMDSVKVQNNAATATASLPGDVQQVGITTRKASNDMSLIVQMSSPDGSYDSVWMKNYISVYMMDKIKRVPGVGDVNVFGSDYSMRIWLNPDKLAELNLTIANVTAALNEQNVQAPAGTIGQMPAPRDQEKQYTGKVQGRLTTPEEFGNVILRAEPNGAFIRLKDVARIETGAKTNNIEVRQNGGATSVAFGVMMTNDANAMETVSGVKKIVEETQQELPPGLELTEIVDSTKFIRNSIEEVLHTFFEALVLVVLVIFIFLQSWRATLIPLIAVPVSLIGTFGSFVLLDFSINTLTLFAMVLAIGLVVDDAIVVIENVEHHMTQEGLSPIDATERAMDEVQGPVVAIAVVLASVFVPMAFLGGMTGILYKQFSLTIAVSMGISAFVALTLTPALCAMMLKPHDPEAKKSVLDRFFDAFNQWFERLTNRYTGIVAWSLKQAKLAIVFMAVIIAGIYVLFNALPSTLVPDEDQGYYVVSTTLPEGTSLNRTMETAQPIADMLGTLPGVDRVMAITGFDILSFGSKPNASTMFVALKPWEERTTMETNINTLIGKSIGMANAARPEAFTLAFNTPALPGLGMVGGFTMQLQDLQGHTEEGLDQITKQIVAAANARPELQGVRTTYSIASPTVEFDVDREKVKNLGVQLSDVFTAMQVNYGGYQVNDFNEFGRSYKVMLQADTDYRNASETTRFFFVKNNAGTMVPLNTLLTPHNSTGPTIISRFNNARAVQIQGNAAEGYSSGQAIAAIQEVVHEVAPTGFGIEWSGTAREEVKASGSTARVIALALVFVFLALAALYESWSVPFAVLMTVPTGIFGALFSEWLIGLLYGVLGLENGGLQNSLYMQIGIIMIMGLAAKNAILIVEFAKVRVDRGMDPFKAAVEAAGLRLRPILMTSFAFILGCVPLAIASGAGSAARNGMGVAVVGGMTFATMVGIFLIPVFYIIVEKVAHFLGGGTKRGKEKTSTDYM
ncbi:efflux RND transporter permease subunit [Selenomonas sp. TAMA-11512]|uniref:efflux RND transporter permease subunit n=1 Tax=Selenomonas sp. TAMA-11512 TaxID=3095337 RepID=UPI0030883643|nr:efflux RND transporter permease subunit [Selenomonas sp. TAMA-11512]